MKKIINNKPFLCYLVPKKIRKIKKAECHLNHIFFFDSVQHIGERGIIYIKKNDVILFD